MWNMIGIIKSKLNEKEGRTAQSFRADGGFD